jgi:hypothetical protein
MITQLLVNNLKRYEHKIVNSESRFLPQISLISQI